MRKNKPPSFPTAKLKHNASQSFTAIIGEIIPGRKITFVLKCSNLEQKKKKFCPRTKREVTYTIGLAAVHPGDRAGTGPA